MHNAAPAPAPEPAPDSGSHVTCAMSLKFIICKASELEDLQSHDNQSQSQEFQSAKVKEVRVRGGRDT